MWFFSCFLRKNNFQCTLFWDWERKMYKLVVRMWRQTSTGIYCSSLLTYLTMKNHFALLVKNFSHVLMSSYALIGLHVSPNVSSEYIFHLGHITWISIKIHFTRTLPTGDGSKCVKDIKLLPLHSPSLILFELGRSLTLFWNHIFLGTL